jgi:hypothetical protein
MNKTEVFNLINSGKAILTGSVRTVDNKVQLDKWKIKNEEFMVTSMGKLRNDSQLHNNPEYINERLQQLITIE